MQDNEFIKGMESHIEKLLAAGDPAKTDPAVGVPDEDLQQALAAHDQGKRLIPERESIFDDQPDGAVLSITFRLAYPLRRYVKDILSELMDEDEAEGFELKWIQPTAEPVPVAEKPVEVLTPQQQAAKDREDRIDAILIAAQARHSTDNPDWPIAQHVVFAEDDGRHPSRKGKDGYVTGYVSGSPKLFVYCPDHHSTGTTYWANLAIIDDNGVTHPKGKGLTEILGEILDKHNKEILGQ